MPIISSNDNISYYSGSPGPARMDPDPDIIRCNLSAYHEANNNDNTDNDNASNAMIYQ